MAAMLLAGRVTQRWVRHVRALRAYHHKGPWTTLDDEIDQQLSGLSTSTLWAALGHEGDAPSKAEILARMGAAKVQQPSGPLPTDQLWEDLESLADKYETQGTQDAASAASAAYSSAMAAAQRGSRPDALARHAETEPECAMSSAMGLSMQAHTSSGVHGGASTSMQHSGSLEHSSSHSSSHGSIAMARILAPLEAVERTRSALIHTARAAGVLAAKRADQIAPLHMSHGVASVDIDISITPADDGRACIHVLCSVAPHGDTEAMAGCMGASLSIFAAVHAAGPADIELQLQ
ncbi:hypothetical protein MCUN1_002993 [Malassezia cuniculi]|uniref:Molybdopterin cofactor biosynthesis C (MoaC) domain-containing protein n=1 Tax=Malassezia cuniculi TaxID=948313 RepID=A0AAF0EWP6_9BASI|nr:hypothetical protein MCUN1_002993 [Malassezia cuniculi]